MFFKRIDDTTRYKIFLGLGALLLCFGWAFTILRGPELLFEPRVLVAQPAVLNPVPFLDNDGELSLFDEITATSALVIDASSSAVLFEKESNLSLPPASTTKLMTALVAREEYALDTVVDIQLASAAQQGASMGLFPGERITVAELLRGLLIQSGNDAAHALMLLDESGDTGFLRKMNAKARELHLEQTFFTNPIGFDDQYQRSSAKDLLLLAKVIMSDPVLSSIVASKRAVLTDEHGFATHSIVNTNQFLHTNPYIRGIKTGTTIEAGEVLITEFFKDGRHLIAVVMGSTDRYQDTQILLNGVLSQYRWYDVISKE